MAPLLSSPLALDDRGDKNLSLRIPDECQECGNLHPVSAGLSFPGSVYARGDCRDFPVSQRQHLLVIASAGRLLPQLRDRKDIENQSLRISDEVRNVAISFQSVPNHPSLGLIR
jgi:hypothetical protein